MPIQGELHHNTYGKACTEMVQIIHDGARDPRVREKALEITRAVRYGNHALGAQALFLFVRDAIQYVPDPSTEDLYTSPGRLLDERAGDCDDKALLFCALARSIGYPTRLCFVFTDPPEEYGSSFPAHVYAAVDVSRGEGGAPKWVPVETIPIPWRGGYQLMQFGQEHEEPNTWTDCIDVDR